MILIQLLFSTLLYRPTYQKIIRGEGLPVYNEENNSNKRGDMVIQFKLNRSQYISETDELCKSLSDNIFY